MRKFNLKKAKSGDFVATRAGKDVKILLFDRNSAKFPIVAIIDNKEVLCYTIDGKFYADKDSDKDLLMK